MLTAYFSHPIRGAKGPDATADDIFENCLHCSAVAHNIELETGIELYIPADHDEVINMAYNYGHISERGILEADCRILAKRDFVLAYARDGHVSRGMRVEIEHALAIGKSVFMFGGWDETAIASFKHFSLSLSNHSFHRHHIHGLYGGVVSGLTPHNYLTEIGI
jgi:hypothetical protein